MRDKTPSSSYWYNWGQLLAFVWYVCYSMLFVISDIWVINLYSVFHRFSKKAKHAVHIDLGSYHSGWSFRGQLHLQKFLIIGNYLFLFLKWQSAIANFSSSRAKHLGEDIFSRASATPGVQWFFTWLAGHPNPTYPTPIPTKLSMGKHCF